MTKSANHANAGAEPKRIVRLKVVTFLTESLERTNNDQVPPHRHQQLISILARSSHPSADEGIDRDISQVDSPYRLPGKQVPRNTPRRGTTAKRGYASGRRRTQPSNLLAGTRTPIKSSNATQVSEYDVLLTTMDSLVSLSAVRHRLNDRPAQPRSKSADQIQIFVPLNTEEGVLERGSNDPACSFRAATPGCVHRETIGTHDVVDSNDYDNLIDGSFTLLQSARKADIELLRSTHKIATITEAQLELDEKIASYETTIRRLEEQRLRANEAKEALIGERAVLMNERKATEQQHELVAKEKARHNSLLNLFPQPREEAIER